MNSPTHRQTLAARVLFGTAALLSFGLSVGLYFSGSHTDGIFVGLWVPSILALGALVSPREAAAQGPGRDREAGR
jgi:hypothetical protein